MDSKQPPFNAAKDWVLFPKKDYSDLLLGPGLDAKEPVKQQLDQQLNQDLKHWLNLSEHPQENPQQSPLKPKPKAQAAEAQAPSHKAASSQLPQSLTSVLPGLMRVVHEICDELTQNPTAMLSLNFSRREALVQHLCRLAGMPASQEPSETALRKWLDGAVSPAQKEALRTFREEVALICLGQAVLLKSWADKGVRNWSDTDLSHLNWALSHALKPLLPLDREGWQITKPNLYSWYNPSQALQREISALLSAWSLTEEGPSLLISVLSIRRKAPQSCSDFPSYDSRFYSKLWQEMKRFGVDPYSEPPGPLARRRVFFTPTLRDGDVVRTSPEQLQWVALESSPFRLLSAELAALWWGPVAPPLWSVGSGLEVHTREQLALELQSAKPSLLSKIAEMEACDGSMILEEITVRTYQKTSEATLFKSLVERLPYFKRLRAPETSLGTLQACVAMSKLRPGGLLWWAREEPLSAREGTEALRFLLDRSRLLCEWDLSEVQHSLPTSMPLFAKYLYVFSRDVDVERRRGHRPIRVRATGNLRSHIELPLFLTDLLGTYSEALVPRGSWEFFRNLSPTAQQEWPDHWPNLRGQDDLKRLERLREQSLPLGQIATVRFVSHSAGQASRSAMELMDGPTVRQPVLAVTLGKSEKRELKIYKKVELVPGGEAALLIGLPDASWLSPLEQYLKSDWISDWLDVHAERKQSRWILSDSTFKMVPIPRALVHALQNESQGPEYLSADLIRELEAEPAKTRLNLRRRLTDVPLEQRQAWVNGLFVSATQASEGLLSSQSKLLSLVRENGQVHWRELLQVLPSGQGIPFTQHPDTRIVGSIASHLPIDRIQRMPVSSPGILFSTESGFHLQIRMDQPVLLEILWDQVQDLRHSTWSEIAQNITLPKDLSLAKSVATDILKSYSQEMSRISELQNLLKDLLLYLL